jgi:1-acyl-sn-glycerol-3-phosphate acyltransferase
MSPLSWLVLAVVLLLLPWILAPSRGEPLEIRGFKRVVWWINAFYAAFWHRLEVVGRAPLPEHGPALLISNHTCGIDPMILQAGCRRVLGFMIAQEFYDAWYCRPFCHLTGCIPVRRDGHDLAATRAALRALAEGRVVPIFPEGRITPTSGREFAPAKPGAAFIALHARVPVVPAYISGTPETNDVLRALQTPSRARLIFGPQVDMSRFDQCEHLDRDQLAEATEILMGSIRALRESAPIGGAADEKAADRVPETRRECEHASA